ncbi:Hypothetical predicted protein [Mytilus galloprovincialis]|uniref:Ig-like domain-containing protein n=1 Tax=Mytilus galloprovincialis TaxID=29158 RepID=A0A8B6HTN0_MYTGA|nr:Hypothetical predicted protein [Mytilus galloprovincialis]
MVEGSFAAKVKVSISPNITGLLGNNDISLTCSFTNEAVGLIVRVQFFAKNKTDEFDFTKPIAKFEPDKPARLLLSGIYLNSRVTLTDLKSTSTNATLTFLELKCDDEKDYMCQCVYDNGAFFLESSPPTRISVEATSSKPNSISIIIVLSTKTEIQGYSSPIYNNFISTNHNAILTSQTLPVERITSIHMQSTDNFKLSFREGDSVMFTCKGDIGNPPGKLVWQKTFPQGKKPITYSNETTYIEEIPDRCSFKGTSHLIVKVFAEDIKATIRCFEESQVNAAGMFLETVPFDIQYTLMPLFPKYNSTCSMFTVHVDELPSSKDSSLMKIFIVYVIPVVCAVLFIVICVAVIKHWCIRSKKKENEENYYQTLSNDGITVNAEYTSVIHTNNTYVREAKNDLVCSNDKERNENNSRNRDELQTGYLTCIEATGITSVNDPANYEDLIASGQTVVYDEIHQQRTLNTEVSKAHKSVSTDHGDHYDIMDVTVQSSVIDG